MLGLAIRAWESARHKRITTNLTLVPPLKVFTASFTIKRLLGALHLGVRLECGPQTLLKSKKSSYMARGALINQ